MKPWLKSAALIFLGCSLLACSSKDDDEEKEIPVAKLTAIDASVFPKVDWQVKSGVGVGEYFSTLRPAVRYEKIFSADRFGTIRAYDLKTKERLWEQDFTTAFRDNILAKNKGARLSAGIVSARNKLFIGSERGLVVALNEANGEVVWSKDLNAELLSAPVVAENMVIFHSGSGSLYALDVDSGELAWQHDEAIPALTLRGTSEPVFEAGGVFVGGADGKVSVLIANNGQIAWQQNTSQNKGNNDLERMRDIDMRPVIYGENLYVLGFNGNLSSLDLRSGRIVWQRKYSGFNNIEVTASRIFMVTDDDRLYAIDRQNGLELWSVDNMAKRALTAPAVFDKYVLVGDFEGYLHVYEQSDGKAVGRKKIDGGGLYLKPQVIGEQLLLLSRDGKLSLVSL